MRDYEVEDIERRAAQHPKSFFIPTRDERLNQPIGAELRLHFVLLNPAEDGLRAERMWVEVTERLPSGDYRGVLPNAPVSIKSIKLGDTVEFSACHIAQIMIKRSDPRWFADSEKSAMVSQMVFQDREIVRFLYREEPDGPNDSGWRVFTGRETDEYTDDAKNIRICNLAWLIDYDPTLDTVLRAPIRSVFEREDQQTPWQPVTDWQPTEE